MLKVVASIGIMVLMITAGVLMLLLLTILAEMEEEYDER